MTEKLKIEEKVDIAADAAISIHAYLEELNSKLVENKVANAFSICIDTEEMIVEILKAVGSERKLGEDVVMQLIQDEFGTPDQFVSLYLEDDNNDLHVNDDAFVLRKRYKKEKSSIIPNRSQFTLANYIYKLFPIFLLTYSLFLYMFVGFIEIFSYGSSYILSIIGVATLFFVFDEFVSGVRGKLIIKKSHFVLTRYIFKGLMLSHLMISLFIYNYTKNYSNNIISYYTGYFFRNDMINNIKSNIMSFNLILIFLMIIVEFTIISRDHIDGFYPIEPEFRQTIRFFTPPYTLLGIAIITSIMSFDNDLFPWIALITSIISYFIVKIKKYWVTYRFYIILMVSQILASLAIQYMYDIPIQLWVIILFIEAIYILSVATELNLGIGLYSRISGKFKEYYETKDKGS